MYNPQKYLNSDAAQPAFIVKNNKIVNPAYPDKVNQIDVGSVFVSEDLELIMALKHRLKRARKKNDRRKIRAIEIMLKEIKQYERRHK